jgi:hypothetical protein
VDAVERAVGAFSSSPGATSTLATLPDPQAFQGADFDGQHLVSASDTCAGTIVDYQSDVATITPAPPLSRHCPVSAPTHGTLRPNAHGYVNVAVSCPQGCIIGASFGAPSVLSTANGRDVTLAPGASGRVGVKLGPRQLRYLRRHRRVRVRLRLEEQEPLSLVSSTTVLSLQLRA